MFEVVTCIERFREKKSMRMITWLSGSRRAINHSPIFKQPGVKVGAAPLRPLCNFQKVSPQKPSV